MDNQQQALLTLRPIDQQRPQQRTALQVKAALGIGVQRLTLLHVRRGCLPQKCVIGLGAILRTPLPRCFLETQAQRIMVLQQRTEGLLQRMRLKRQTRLQQQRLVPMLTVWHVGVEEPMLDGCQCRLTTESSLLGVVIRGARRNRRQCPHRLVLKQVTWAEMNAQLPRTADHLNRQNRVAAQFKEVIVETDLFEVQHIAPHTGQALLQRVAGGHILLTVQLRVRGWQGAPIELAIGRQRHAGQQHQVGRDHVVGQLHLELRFEFIP